MWVARLTTWWVVAALALPASAMTFEEAVDRTVGQYSTAAQAATGKGKARHVYVTRVSMPKVGPLTLYLEWHDPDASGPVTSQRIWSFHQDGANLSMRYYTLNESADKNLRGVRKSGDGDLKAIASLTTNDLHGYPDNCHFEMELGEIVLAGETGKDCVIYNRSESTNMRPEVRLSFQQAGFIEDGIFSYESTGARERIIQEFMRIP